MNNTKYTKKVHEEYLNNLYSETYSIEEAINNFIYLSKNKNTIIKHYNSKKLGSFLRKNDLIAFNCSYNDKCRNK